MKLASAAALVLLSATVAQAQEKASGARASTEGISAVYGLTKNFVLGAVEKIPEDKFSFQPTKEVRTVGALFAHIADANSFFCSQVSASPKQYSDNVEKTAKTKAELVAALKASFAECDAAYGATVDAALATPVTVFGMKQNFAGVLTMNAAHNYEHYGNIVTYMRILNIVPPSSQQ
jgi:uncharacterized damage-inducible protein DinB